MSTLTGQYISQSYGGLIHLSTNTGIAAGVSTQLEDGVGTSLGIYFRTGGQINATGYTGSLLGNASTATSASYAINAANVAFATSSSYASNAQTAFSATSASFATTASFVSTASFATNAAGVPGLVPTASFNPYTASINNYTASLKTAFTASGTSTTFNGANYNNIVTLSVASQTASINLSQSNLYSLTLVSGYNTYISASNINAGQVISLVITQPTGGIGSATFAPSITFPSGSYYTASLIYSATDLITMISFNTSSLRAVASNNFI
jgi:hypothetical protein